MECSCEIDVGIDDAGARSKAMFSIEAAVIGPRYSGMND
jgi:hypothetical protein